MSVFLITYALIGLLLFLALGGFKQDRPVWTHCVRLLVSLILGPIIMIVGVVIAWRRVRRG